ncbi:MAG: hypothetical protein KJ052_10205, partial [Candidatus Hydrogenedentes bacterium]|nr:hypothetical protein [Candidatus Hydrogenedentota bacterium]
MSLLTPLPSLALVRSELLRNLRKITPVIFLTLIVLFNSAAVIMNWPLNDNVSTLYWQSSNILVVLVAFLMTLLVVMVPGHAAASIAAERQRGTFEMTRLTLISAGGCVVAKVINTIGLYMLLVFACAPILAVQFFLFGMEWQTLLYGMIVIFATAIACASVGVFISSINSRPATATILSFAATFVLMGGPLAMLYVVVEIMGLRGFAATLEQLMTSFSPVAVLFESTTRGASLSEAAPLFCYLAVWSNLFIVLAIVAVKKSSSSESEGGSSQGVVRRVWGFVHSRVLGRSYYKRRLPAIPDVLNPVFVVESRWGKLTKHGALIRIFLAVLVLNLTFGGFICFNAAEFGIWAFEYSSVVIGMDFFLACLLFPGVLANAFVKEAEQDNMDFLRSTLLTPFELVWGKCAAGLRTMMAFLAGVAFGALSQKTHFCTMGA